MTAYISVSFSARKHIEKELAAINKTLIETEITPHVFVDIYKFDPSQEQQMMQQALTDIDKCDLFIAEVSNKAIGIGVEAGYAKAKGKPVIYIRQPGAEHSTTVSGISDFQIVYSDPIDLQTQLAATLRQIKTAGY